MRIQGDVVLAGVIKGIVVTISSVMSHSYKVAKVGMSVLSMYATTYVLKGVFDGTLKKDFYDTLLTLGRPQSAVLHTKVIKELDKLNYLTQNNQPDRPDGAFNIENQHRILLVALEFKSTTSNSVGKNWSDESNKQKVTSYFFAHSFDNK